MKAGDILMTDFLCHFFILPAIAFSSDDGFTSYMNRFFSLPQVLLIIALACISLVVWEIYPVAILLLVSLLLIILFIHRLDWGVYALAALSFFHEWEIDFSRSERFRDLPYIPQINAPAADILAIFLLIAVVLSIIFHHKKIPWKSFFLIRRGIVIYGIFLVIAAIAAYYFMYNNFYTAGIKYWLRPIVFTWLVYWLMTVGIIVEKPKIFQRVLSIWFGAGLLIAVYGLASFFVLDQSGWIRALPFSINGFAPLGYNHNQIAEALVAILPIGIWIALTKKDLFARRLAIYGSMLIGVIALLTLSRAAWIVITVELIILGIYLYRLRGKKMLERRVVGSLLLVLVPAFIYTAIFLTSSIVTSSTSNRLDAAKVSAFYWSESPWFGYGPGSYMWLLTDTAFYTMEYGDPLDAHGFVQKMLVEEGILGCLAFVGFLFWLLWFIWTAQKK
jgi:O-antigen ligase